MNLIHSPCRNCSPRLNEIIPLPSGDVQTKAFPLKQDVTKPTTALPSSISSSPFPSVKAHGWESKNCCWKKMTFFSVKEKNKKPYKKAKSRNINEIYEKILRYKKIQTIIPHHNYSQDRSQCIQEREIK